MSLEDLFGYSDEIRVLDLIIPLSDATTFTIDDVERGSSLGFKEAHKILDDLAKRRVLVKSGPDDKPVYRKSSHSKVAWALDNLIHSIYGDRLRLESLAKMEPKKKRRS